MYARMRLSSSQLALQILDASRILIDKSTENVACLPSCDVRYQRGLSGIERGYRRANRMIRVFTRPGEAVYIQDLLACSLCPKNRKPRFEIGAQQRDLRDGVRLGFPNGVQLLRGHTNFLNRDSW